MEAGTYTVTLECTGPGDYRMIVEEDHLVDEAVVTLTCDEAGMVGPVAAFTLESDAEIFVKHSFRHHFAGTGDTNAYLVNAG